VGQAANTLRQELGPLAQDQTVGGPRLVPRHVGPGQCRGLHANVTHAATVRAGEPAEVLWLFRELLPNVEQVARPRPHRHVTRRYNIAALQGRPATRLRQRLVNVVSETPSGVVKGLSLPCFFDRGRCSEPYRRGGLGGHLQPEHRVAPALGPKLGIG
jgi:hypothetical protein